MAVRLRNRRWMLREWHAHETLEVNLILNGSGWLLMGDRRIPLRAGHLIWLWPGVWHLASEWSSDLVLWVAEWQPPWAGRLQRARRKDSPSPLNTSTDPVRVLDPAALRRMDGMLEAVSARHRTDALNRGLAFALFALWDEYQQAAPLKRDCSFHPRVEEALRRAGDIQSPLSLHELAENVGVSPTYLSALFQQQTGLSLPAYRNRLRLQEFFRRLQARPDISLLGHALDAGFGSYAQFYRVFASLMGCSPREWQQRENTNRDK